MKIKDKFYSVFDVDSIDDIPNAFWLERYRNWRLEELKETDWTQLPDAPVDSESWANYRQKLRDLPEIKDFANAELPERPL